MTEPGDDGRRESTEPEQMHGSGPVSTPGRLQERYGAEDEKGSPAVPQGEDDALPAERRVPEAPLEPPLLESMNVGTTDPQLPSRPGRDHPVMNVLPTTGDEPAPDAGPHQAPQDLTGPGQTPDETRPVSNLGNTTGTDRGPVNVQSHTPGRSHRVPGLQGEEAPGERVETDLHASASAMVPTTGRPAGPGDPHGAPVPSTTASTGTSEEHGKVQGARIPQEESPE